MNSAWTDGGALHELRPADGTAVLRAAAAADDGGVILGAAYEHGGDGVDAAAAMSVEVVRDGEPPFVGGYGLTCVLLGRDDLDQGHHHLRRLLAKWPLRGEYLSCWVWTGSSLRSRSSPAFRWYSGAGPGSRTCNPDSCN